MELVFQQKRLKIQSPVTLEKVAEKISELLEDNYYFSHFVADGIEVNEINDSFLKLHIQTIKRLEVIAKTSNEFINDIILETENYTIRALPELGLIAEEFYNNPNAETWIRFDQLLEGLQWLNGMIEVVRQNKERPYNWNKYEDVVAVLNVESVNLAEAVGNKDYVLIGDIIQYEILHCFETLKSITQTTIDNEGKRPNLN